MYEKVSIPEKIIQNTLKKWAYDDIIQKELKRPRQKQYKNGKVEWLNQKRNK